MNLDEFRISHSTVMEHYQFIEIHVEGIYAALSGKQFYIGLQDVERYSISVIIKMIQEQERRHNKTVISDSEYKELEVICLRRNFWTHDCYTELIFDRKTNAPKYEADRKQLYHDIRIARDMRELLYDKQMKVV